jgi:hypothetical protein
MAKAHRVPLACASCGQRVEHGGHTHGWLPLHADSAPPAAHARPMQAATPTPAPRLHAHPPAPPPHAPRPRPPRPPHLERVPQRRLEQALGRGVQQLQVGRVGGELTENVLALLLRGGRVPGHRLDAGLQALLDLQGGEARDAGRMGPACASGAAVRAQARSCRAPRAAPRALAQPRERGGASRRPRSTRRAPRAGAEM